MIMKRTLNKISLVALLALVSWQWTLADDNLKKEIVVDKEYVPVEQKVTKPNETPRMVKLKPSTKDLQYSSWVSPLETGNGISLLHPYGYNTSANYSDQRGYLDFGAGMFLNMVGSAGYRIVETDNTSLNIWLQHNSTWSGKPSDSDLVIYGGSSVETGKQKFSDDKIGIDFAHNFKKLTLKASASYNFAYQNYFYTIANDDRSSKVNDFAFDLKAESRSGDNLNYYVGLGFNRFGSKVSGDSYYWYDYVGNGPDMHKIYYKKDGITETDVDLIAGVSMVWNDNSLLGMDFDFRYLGYSGGIGFNTTGETNPYTYEDVDRGRIQLSPYYMFVTRNLSVKLGANVDFGIKEGGLKLSPNVNMEWQNNNRNFTLFANVSGGRAINDFASVFALNRYVSLCPTWVSAFTPLDARIGAKIGPIAGFSASVWGGYSINRDALVYQDTDTKSGYLSTIYTNHDIKGFGFGADLNYKYGEKFEVGAKAVVTDHDKKNGYYTGLLRANCDLDIFAKVSPIRNLSIRADYRALIGKNFDSYENYQNQDRFVQNENADAHMLSLSARYQVCKMLGVWLQGNNLLNKSYCLVPDFYSQKLNVMGGISLRF